MRPHILKMAGYTSGEQPRAGKVIKLNTNESPYPPSPSVKQAVLAAVDQGLSRYPDALATSFRVRAAELHGVEPDWILCGNGSDDLLTILARAYLGEGDLLRYPSPSYVLYKTLADLQQAAVEEIPFASDWSFSADFLRQDPRLKLAVVPNPNSPTGTLIPPAQLLQAARSLPCPLLVDEAYGEFATDHCVGLIAAEPKLLVTRTLSKSYALAGLRFGYLIAQPEIIRQLRKVKDSYNCDALSIAAATAAIDDQAWLAENCAKIQRTRVTLTSGLERLGFTVIPSQANFVWCTHAEHTAESVYEGLKAAQILVRYMRYPDWQAGLRISVGTDAQVAALLSTLEQLLV